MKKITVHICIYLFSLSAILAQEYYFRHYEVADGISHNTIHCAVQDTHGFMWFGTKNGLNRFDGYTFKLFQNDATNPYSLGSNFVECLDYSDDKLWIGTDSGLFEYDLKTERFYLLEITRDLPILDIENDQNGYLWFIGGSTLFKYNKKTSEVTKFLPETFINAEEITVSPNGEIWVASSIDLYRYDRKDNTFENFELHPVLDNDLPFNITKIAVLDVSTILIGTGNHGAFLFDLPHHLLKKILQTDNTRIFVRDFLRKKNDLWIATESGVFIYNLYTGVVKNLTKDYNNPYALSDNAVYCLAKDNVGGVWIGTYFGGVNYFPKQLTPFQKYFHKIGENSISGSAVREIRQDHSGNLWIGTEDAGLNKFDTKTGIFTNYTLRDLQNGLVHNNIHGILPLKNEVWVGTFENGLDVVDMHTGKVIKQYKAGPESGLKSNFIVSLYRSKDNTIYAITASGIHKYHTETDKFLVIDRFPPDYFYTSFMEDSNGVFWAGTYWDGLYYYDPKKNIYGSYKKNGKNRSTLSSNAINGIFEDNEHSLWITTENGLNLKKSNDSLFKKYTAENGFPSNVFYTVIQEKDDVLWISTSNGLVKFNTDTEKVYVYAKENGTLSNQFNYNSVYKDNNGILYFGTVKGMISFSPTNFKDNKNDAPIALTGFQINNEKVRIGGKESPLVKSISFTDKIELNHDQSSINIEFASLNFTAPGLTEYSYKMKGLNNNWVNLGRKNTVFFTELSTGHYEFLLRSRIGNGNWSQEELALEVDVLPPFWASNMAYLTYFGLVAILLFLTFRYYRFQIEIKNNKKIKQFENRMEKEVFKAKIEFFTNISHEIRTPLTLIKSPLEKILPKVNDHELKEYLLIMKKNTSRLLNLVNQLLDFRKTEIEQVNLTFVKTNIPELIRNMHSRFYNASTEKKINFDINLPENDVYAFIDVEGIKKILSNLFTNAMKYAEKQIYLSLKFDQEYFEICIKNDGSLIPSNLKEKIFEPFFRLTEHKNETGTGIGLSLAHALAELHNGSLKITTEDPLMNTFVLTLPIHQEKEFEFYSLHKPAILPDESQPTKPEEPTSNKPIVLLVEDNQDLLDFLAKDLMESYCVKKATNSEEALDILRNESIQLIVSDIMMPGIDGFVLCKRVKTNLESSHIPVILLTSKNALNSRIEGLEAGADAYIEKPFSIEHLKVQITNLIRNRRHIIEHFSSSPLAHIKSIAHSKIDEVFIKKLDDVIDNNISDQELSVETLAEIMNMSRSTLYRKIKDLSNVSPNELINITRLKKAAELLKTNNYKVYEVSEMVGYNSATSFGRNFQKQFNMTPTEYVNSEHS